MKKNQKKSPIKKKPLRFAGQSLSEELEDILYDKVLVYIILSIVSLVAAGMEWWRWYFDTPPSPVGITVFAVGITVYSIVRIYLMKDGIRSLKQGRDGECVVGQTLESMRERGCKVFHDIQDWGAKNDDFNLDHVLVCERGIFVIETKTYSKLVKGQSLIKFTGDRLFIDSYENLKIIPQTSAQKQWLERLIYKETGARFSVKPIVVFPGWFIEGDGNKKSSGQDLWVLEPKALPAFISNLPKTLENQDKIRVANALSNYVRREQK